MPVSSQADNNVPFLAPGRARYNLLNVSPTWIYHKMTTGIALDGTAPRTASTNEADTDPTSVTAGEAKYLNLTKGGLFTLLANYKRELIVEAQDNGAGATFTLVKRDGSLSRAWPSAYPFRVAADEVIKATGGSTGGQVGVLVRIAGERQL